MSGVALIKLGDRLLYRLSDEILGGTIAYLGDGSNKHQFDPIGSTWVSDPGYIREFSDAQAVAIVGSERYYNDLVEASGDHSDLVQLKIRVDHAVKEVEKHNRRSGPDIVPIGPHKGLIGELEDLLDESGIQEKMRSAGHGIKEPETYFRGGSVSWMMLGDVSADPYHEDSSLILRKGKLIPHAENRLKEHNDLKDLGSSGVHVPFPGARGIKFVLVGNDKERGARDLITSYDIPSENILFIGNELFEGGNDNMLRNIEGINLLSVGTKEDPGAINWGTGVDANWSLMERIIDDLERGFGFGELIERLKSGK
jgi:hypothetical protein